MLQDQESFNFESYEISDGHNETEIEDTIHRTNPSNKPIVIICNTIKGKGIKQMENNPAWHHKAPSDEELSAMIEELS